MKYLLNAITAKRTGVGGFQISCNFIRFAINDSQHDWYFVVSDELFEFLKNELTTNCCSSHWYVFPAQPNIHSYFKVRNELKQLEIKLNPDVVYSILAPSYFFFSSPEVMRCCNAWNLIDKSHIACKVSGCKYTMEMRAKAPISRYLMRKTSYFITQTQEAKSLICQTIGTSKHNVCVIPNVLSGVFAKADKSQIIHNGFNVVFVGALAPHKNIFILPQICRILKEQYLCKEIKLLTTFNEKEPLFSKLTESFLNNGVADMWENVGHRSQKELIDLYRKSDLGLFPSLLETFSATLIEYMNFGLPIVAADMPFNTDVLDDAALIYPPLDAKGAADNIYAIYSDNKLRDSLRHKGFKRLELFSDFNKYYNDTVDFLTKVAGLNGRN